MTTTRRAALGLTGVGVLGLALLGCERRERLEAGTAEVISGQAELDLLTALPDDLDHSIELPGARYRVLASALVDELDAEVARQLGLPAPADVDGERTLPASGEAFLIATVGAGDARTMSTTSPPAAPVVDRVLLSGTEVPTAVGPLTAPRDNLPERMTKTIVASVPADIAAQDAVLEVGAGDVAQRLSLVDGTRVHSDIEHWYRDEVEVSAQRVSWERYAEEHVPEGPVLAGCVLGGTVQPTHSDGTWPAADHVVLGVEVVGMRPLPSTREVSTMVLQLPDGSEAAADGDPGEALATQGAVRARFDVPADLESATVRIALRLDIGDEVVEHGTEEVVLQIARSAR